MLTRTNRRLAAIVGIAALLFSQMAVAAYACPEKAHAGGGAYATAADEMHAAMPGCGERDSNSENVNLCQQHCQAGSQAVQTSPQTLPPAVLASTTVIELPQPVAASGIVAVSTLPERSTSPPPLLRFGVLRI